MNTHKQGNIRVKTLSPRLRLIKRCQRKSGHRTFCQFANTVPIHCFQTMLCDVQIKFYNARLFLKKIKIKNQARQARSNIFLLLKSTYSKPDAYWHSTTASGTLSSCISPTYKIVEKILLSLDKNGLNRIKRLDFFFSRKCTFSKDKR